MHILILSYFFPPYNTIGAIRVGKFAKHLTDLGHPVDVVAAHNPALEQNDASLPVEIPTEHVRYTPWWDLNGFPRTLAGFVQHRRAKSVLQRGSATVAPTVNALPPRLRGLAKLYLSATNVPDAFRGWAPAAYAAARSIAQTSRVDVILASGPPFTSFLVARRLARQFAIPWVADLRDLWAEKEPYPFIEIRRHLDRWQQTRVLSTVTGAVTVSEPLADSLRADGVQPVAVVYNGFDPLELPPRIEAERNGPLSLLYAGSLYGDPDPLFRALRLLPDRARNIRLAFLLRGDAASLTEHVETYGVGDVVNIADPVGYQECLSRQAAADVLLLVQDEGPRWRGIVSGKIFEYMGAGRPILALSGSDSVVCQLLTNTGSGFASRDPKLIADWLAMQIAQKRASGIPHTDPHRVQDYTRLMQTRRLELFLSDCVARSDRAIKGQT